MNIEFDKIPPQAVDAERAVIGSMLMNPKAIIETMDILEDNADMFYVPSHQYIYQAISNVFDNKNDVDVLMVKDDLERHGHLEDSGGLAYIAELTGSVPTSANCAQYAKIVRDHATMRRIIQIGTEAIHEAYACPEDVHALLDETQAKYGTLAQVPEDTLNHVSEITPEFSDTIRRIASGEIPPGLPTGLKGLDDLTGGLRAGDYFVIAAKTSVGKTALAMNIARNVLAADTPGNVIIFSMEMDKEALLKRLCQSLTQVNFHHLDRQGYVTENLAKMDDALSMINKSGLYIDETSHPTIQHISSKLRKYKTVHGCPDIIIMDYIQLMTAHGKFSNRNDELNRISLIIKGLAREIKCPIIVLSQFNRKSGKDDRPQISELRDSGSIEQDADTILILHPDSENYDILEGHLDKHRNGPTGSMKFRFTKKTQLIEDIGGDTEYKKDGDWMF